MDVWISNNEPKCIKANFARYKGSQEGFNREICIIGHRTNPAMDLLIQFEHDLGKKFAAHLYKSHRDESSTPECDIRIASIYHSGEREIYLDTPAKYILQEFANGTRPRCGSILIYFDGPYGQTNKRVAVEDDEIVNPILLNHLHTLAGRENRRCDKPLTDLLQNCVVFSCSRRLNRYQKEVFARLLLDPTATFTQDQPWIQEIPRLPKQIVYVRHGESVSNKIIHSNPGGLTEEHKDMINSMSNPALTELGQKQAHDTGVHIVDKIIGMGYKKVVMLVSPYDRAIQTSMPFVNNAKIRGLLLDIVNVDEMVEYTTPTRDRDWKSFVDRVKKFNNTLKGLLNDEVDGDAIFVLFGHSLFFSTLLTYQGTQELFEDIPCIAHELPNCSLSVVEYVNRKPQYWAIYHTSDVGHLFKPTGHHTDMCLLVSG